jgi:hypothetical protein
VATVGFQLGDYPGDFFGCDWDVAKAPEAFCAVRSESFARLAHGHHAAGIGRGQMPPAFQASFSSDFG